MQIEGDRIRVDKAVVEPRQVAIMETCHTRILLHIIFLHVSMHEQAN